MAINQAQTLSRHFSSVVRLAAAVVLLAGGASSAFGDGGRGGDEPTLNKQGLESRDQAKEGYSDLNNAAFVLLFNEEIPAGGFFDEPRGVTWMNASNKSLAGWAFNRAFAAYNKRREQEEKAQQASRPKVRFAAKVEGSNKAQAFRAWAGEQGGEAEPAGAVGYNPFDLIQGEGALSQSELDAILEDPTGESAATDPAPLTPIWALVPQVVQPTAAAAPDYEAGRDAILSLIAVPRGGLYFADDEISDAELQQIPGLGEVPSLGELFRSDRGASERSFIVTVTPHIVRDFDD